MSTSKNSSQSHVDLLHWNANKCFIYLRYNTAGVDKMLWDQCFISNMILGYRIQRCIYLIATWLYLKMQNVVWLMVQSSSCIYSCITTHYAWQFVLMLHLPLLSNLPVTQTTSVGLFFPERDGDQCLLPHWSLHRASHEDALHEVRALLFHRSCHWHTVLHCHPAAPARGLPSIHTSFHLHLLSIHLFTSHICLWKTQSWRSL